MELLAGFIPLVILGGIVFFIVSGFRSLTDDAGAPLDGAEIAKSVGLHVGLFAAFIGLASGLIDLFQYFVEEPDRFAGTNTDLARGMSLLIVGIPVYALLLRAIRRRYDERAEAGDTRAHRGWSVYLVAALTTSLVATLVSIGQILGRIVDDGRSFEPNELVQLLVWLVLWLVHWFGLRPRFGVRGDAHLAIGTIAGLVWMLGGSGGVIYRILATGYDKTFNDGLRLEWDVWPWLVVAATGTIVWTWHWLVWFNRDVSTGSLADVEGDRRGSTLWFFIVVVAGVLPALVAILVTTTTMVSGLLVWILGSTEEPAAEYFEPSTSLVTILFIGVLSWAYHRWQLGRRGPAERNEALRFHDYVVVAVGLGGVVTGTAAMIALLIEALRTGSFFAGSFAVGNALIVILTVLAASAAVWWRQWASIERYRAAEPYQESDSIWRKLYLIAGFGLGGIVLATTVIWVIFSVLRDLFDSELGTATVDDITAPLGWALTVVGAVWYHLGVWRVDRAVIAELAPAIPPPPPPNAPAVEVAPPALPLPTPEPTTPAESARVPQPSPGIGLWAATPADHGELFSLQRAAFVDEAQVYGTIAVPPLQENYGQFLARLADSHVIVAVDGTRIVGSVCVREHRNGGPDIERLMVAPDRRREGIATRLLDEAEAWVRSQGGIEIQLIVGDIVHAARTLYEGRGYTVVERVAPAGGPVLLTLHKSLGGPGPRTVPEA